MSTIQLIGIGIATGILIILVIALVITRRRDAATKPAKVKESKKPQPVTPPADLTPETASFLEGAPRDDLHMLRGEAPPAVVPETTAVAHIGRADEADVGSPGDLGGGAAAAGGMPVAGAAVAAGATESAQKDYASDLWTSQPSAQQAPAGTAAGLWGSAAASADVEAAAAGAADQYVAAEPYAGAPETPPTPATPEEPSAVSAPMFVVEAPVSGAQEPAAPRVMPFSTEPPPPWEQAEQGVEIAEAPVEAPVQAPVEAPIPAPAEASVEMPGGAPPETSVEALPGITFPAEQPVEPFAAVPEQELPTAAEPSPGAVAEPEPPTVLQPEPPTVLQPEPPAVLQPEPPAAPLADELAPPQIEEPAVAESGGPAGVYELTPSPATAPPAAAESRPPKLVALGDIITTTNQQTVDLNDPDVRRMLKELAKSEIDLAQQYKQLGQNIDAVLQLTEAQKICQALDMTSHAKLIEQMIQELRA